MATAQQQKQEEMAKNIDRWQKRIAKTAKAVVVPAPEQTEDRDTLRMVMNNDANGKQQAYVEYVAKPVQVKYDEFLTRSLKWHPTFVLYEESTVEKPEGKPEAEVRYKSAVYGNVTGVEINSDDKICLLLSKGNLQLPIVIGQKDARKLTELICSLG